MRVVLYFINFNDLYYLPFIKKHYSFCERIVMYDHYSTDDSVNLALALGMEVRTFGVEGQLNDQHYLDVKNHCWKECRGTGIDYVIVCDADEFITIPAKKLSCSAPRVIGFNMISDSYPVVNIKEINTGAYSENYSKQAIFSPDKIEEINYVHGCHRNNMTGEITTDNTCKLYHYRQIGGVTRWLDRHALYRQRLSAFNIKYKMGDHYNHPDHAKIEEWSYLQSQAVKLW